jgi:predicted DNA-binding transcriptional regulator AlpA
MTRPSKYTATKPPPPDTPRIPVDYVTSREAAAYLGLALPTLNGMRKLGIGPDYVRVSPRRVVYELAALREYAASRTVKPSLA